MRTRITFVICLCLLLAGRASAQWVVSDPGNLAQGIINASKNIIHTSKTATNMVNNFQETVKIYEQGKKYYDALKSVNNLVKDARKVQQTILMVGDITDIYVTSFQKMLRDDNFTVEELGAIAFGYTKLLEESNDVLTELKNVVNITTLSMTDKERMDVVERCHSKMKRYRNLQEHQRELPACEEEKRPRPHHGAVREHERKILVAYGVRQPSPDSPLALRADDAAVR